MSATHEGGNGSVINTDIDMVLRVVEGEREQLQQQDMEAAVARWRPPAGQCWPKLPLGGGHGVTGHSGGVESPPLWLFKAY